MKVFKFGGASVKDVESIQRLRSIVDSYRDMDLWIVISAMAKTTNGLESVFDDIISSNSHSANIKLIKDFHTGIIEELFPFRSSDIYATVYGLLDDLMRLADTYSSSNIQEKDYNRIYSSIVSYGELLSTSIISSYLNQEGIDNDWVDIREITRSQESYTSAEIDWNASLNMTKAYWESIHERSQSDSNIVITQGFISSNSKGESTTLGREGSDFTGAVLSWCLDAEELVIWKDVPGLMNADPKKYDEAILLDKISYREALELSFYGASVIHPKTIKPLQNKGIPLVVKSFLEPNNKGTLVHNYEGDDNKVPSFIFKSDQVLFSISPRDFSMVVEKNISDIYAIIADIGISINLMQNSALNFSICFDKNTQKIDRLRLALEDRYKLLYNDNLELLTIRHYDEAISDKLIKDKEVIIQQLSRSSARFLLKPDLCNRTSS